MKKQLTVGSLIPHNIVSTVSSTIKKTDLQGRRKPTPSQVRGIRLIQNGKKFEVKPRSGQTLLQIAMSQAIPLDYKCQKGTCGRCTVKIIEGESQLSTPNQKEQKTLNNQLQAGYRLACQSVIV